MAIRKIIISTLIFLISILSTLPSLAEKTFQPGQGANLYGILVVPKNLSYVKDLGFDYVRTGVPWDVVEKVKGTYDWRQYDTIVNNITSYNLKPILVIGYNNKLYGAAGTFYGINTDAQRAGLTKYAVASVLRYKGKGIIWEIWNEPSISPFWLPKPVYSDYVKMANSVASAIRKAAPNEIVVAPGVPIGGSGEFLTAAGQGGLFNLIDGISYHFYASNSQAPERINIPYYCRRINEIVTPYKSDRAALPVVASEQGYSSTAAGMNEQLQAQYLARSIVIHKASCPVISIWHNLYQAASDTNPEHNYGLIRQDYSLKPSYLAVKNVVQQLKGMRFVRALTLPIKDDYAYEFTNGTTSVLCVWTASSPHYTTINNNSQYLTNDVKILTSY